ncbi:hypothetical protein [Halorhodospira halochloris]|uniref:hypothetical protein n=1 Tax=Halorhodospira halochloris TaxID=1052 RepID=UPI001EE97FDB|nr:hypothetical protein [Halorhodospira halochloris]
MGYPSALRLSWRVWQDLAEPLRDLRTAFPVIDRERHAGVIDVQSLTGGVDLRHARLLPA